MLKILATLFDKYITYTARGASNNLLDVWMVKLLEFLCTIDDERGIRLIRGGLQLYEDLICAARS